MGRMAAPRTNSSGRSAATRSIAAASPPELPTMVKTATVPSTMKTRV